MGYGVLLLMIVIMLMFVMKQTFNIAWVSFAIAALCAVSVVVFFPYAASMSKSQLTQWLGNQSLLLDAAVIICVESALVMLFCIRSISFPMSWLTRVLQWLPGVMIIPVLLYVEASLMFTLTGMSFSLIAWILALAVLIVLPLLSLALRRLIPEHELRLELLFLLALLSAFLSILTSQLSQVS